MRSWMDQRKLTYPIKTTMDTLLQALPRPPKGGGRIRLPFEIHLRCHLREFPNAGPLDAPAAIFSPGHFVQN